MTITLNNLKSILNTCEKRYGNIKIKSLISLIDSEIVVGCKTCDGRGYQYAYERVVKKIVDEKATIEAQYDGKLNPIFINTIETKRTKKPCEYCFK